MSSYDGSDTMTALAAPASTRPRAATVAGIWQELALDVDVFNNRQGAPLARTVKCLLDPLVIRPRLRPHLARPTLGSSEAAELRELFTAAAAHLEHAAEWYRLLRAERRARAITHGNAQELYFPRAYELAVSQGAPGPFAQRICAEVLSEIHDDGGHRLDDLAAELADPQMQRECQGLLAQCWPASGPAASVPMPELADQVLAVLGSATDSAEDLWLQLVDSAVVAALGAALQTHPGQLDQLWAGVGAHQASVRVSRGDPQQPPPYGDDAERPLVLDRSVTRRARAAVRRGAQADTVRELILDEARRAARPWGLRGADRQAAFVVGLVVAAFVRALGDPPAAGPPLVGQIQARVRKEAYVLHARRLWSAGQPTHPRQREVVAELVDFWRPYLQRLWVRLHGRDVLNEPELDLFEVRELLAGIAKSVTLDHRQRIRDVLERAAG